ncbi:hypothetical protein GH714_032790 [Hevea brasiliensis]|uniref:Pentacotripeptide-repeat region of PRORP domain-containing protein n=1 Tax=Hevea brasiliensis TaxID=3981 RepID=A0A6A6NE20_HEVBR|nr:hypothetical protein GH714_032790 [Hevea brasiliensis]
MVTCLSCAVNPPSTRTPFLSSYGHTSNRKFGSHEALILIQKCSNFSHLKLIHAKIIRNGLSNDQLLVRKLLQLCFSYGKMDYASLLFHQMRCLHTFTWNFMIRLYTNNGSSQQALLLHNLMIFRGFPPDKFTFPFTVKACLASSALEKGKEVHGFATKTGFWKDTFFHNTWMDLLFECGAADYGRKEAFELLWRMQLYNVRPNEFTLVGLLKACTELGSLQLGSRIHDYALKNGFKLGVFLGTALVDMYSKCGSLVDAKQVFDKMQVKSLAAWNSMITSLGVHGCGKEALAVFAQMEEANIKPYAITFVGVLCACVRMNNVEEGDRYFNYMTECYGITPILEHYTCMIKL